MLLMMNSLLSKPETLYLNDHVWPAPLGKNYTGGVRSVFKGDVCVGGWNVNCSEKRDRQFRSHKKLCFFYLSGFINYDLGVGCI